MIIYFVNKNSSAKGPFDIKYLHHQNIIKIGDICIRDTGNRLSFLWVVSESNKWCDCKCLSIVDYDELSIEGNAMLFSFNGVGRRFGNIPYLQELSHVFSLEPFHVFFTNAIQVLQYKIDLLDAELLLKIHSASIVKNQRTAKSGNNTNNKLSTSFIDYFGKELLTPFDMLSNDLSLKEKYMYLRSNYPTEFKQALFQFIKDNPKSNIYSNE